MATEQSDISIEATLASLKRRGFETRFVENRKAAQEMVLTMIPVSSSVGCGGSATLRQIGIMEELARRGTVVIEPQSPELRAVVLDENAISAVERLNRLAMACDFFLSGTNVLTVDGRLVNVDGTGNRVSGMVFGPKRVILVAGRNKIVPNLDLALDRLRHVVAPVHLSRVTPFKKTPCVVTGKCNDCWGPERSCCITTIIEGRPLCTQITVILVNEDLGLGWDPDWSEERISMIRAQYEAVMFPVKIFSRSHGLPSKT